MTLFLPPPPPFSTYASHQASAVVTVKEADATQSATAGYKKAVLDNGRSVRVPPFLAAGDVIIISLPEENDLGKSDGTALDDDDRR